MKRVLITGERGYIGRSFANWLSQWPDEYETYFLSLRDDSWRTHDFGRYYVILHAAGIVHQKEVDPEIYDRVNHQVTAELAHRVRAHGVRHFIFLSTMSVYGDAEGEITADTPIAPDNSYGSSKFEAEQALEALAGSHFRVMILRPPMVYGSDCPGNFASLVSIARKMPIFPEYPDQKRSMIFVDNLCSFLRYAVDQELSGLYFPQDPDYVNTSEMVVKIAQVHGKRMRTTRLFNILLKFMQGVAPVKKAFGSLYYAHDLPGLNRMKSDNYVVYRFQEAVEKAV